MFCKQTFLHVQYTVYIVTKMRIESRKRFCQICKIASIPILCTYEDPSIRKYEYGVLQLFI